MDCGRFYLYNKDMKYGLYIHIPFCKSKCPYCDFYSIPYNRKRASLYIDILSNQIEKLNYKFETVYIGGGTPTVLDADLLDILLRKLVPICASSKENTIEVNPESLNKDKCALLLKRGINRISVGVQSLQDKKLALLGRVHSSCEAVKAVLLAKEKGFTNISADCIYGVPGESLREWKKELAEIVKLPVQHLSCYSLTCEKGTPIYRDRRGIEEEVVACMYEWNISFLPRRKFFHYEVSNFAKRGYKCRHNLLYWDNNPYVGLGAGAFSYQKEVRTKNVADVSAYIKAAKEGKSPVIFEEKLQPLRRARETASLLIRRKKGVDFATFKRKTGFDFWSVERKKALSPLIEQKLLRYKKRCKKITGVILTRKGFLFADEVSSRLV